jgi:hypothetical protein
LNRVDPRRHIASRVAERDGSVGPAEQSPMSVYLEYGRGDVGATVFALYTIPWLLIIRWFNRWMRLPAAGVWGGLAATGWLAIVSYSFNGASSGLGLGPGRAPPDRMTPSG